MDLGPSLLLIDVKIYCGVVLFLISLLAKQPKNILGESSEISQDRIKVVCCRVDCIFNSKIPSPFLLVFKSSLISYLLLCVRP